MYIFPAIDLYDGKAVRLYNGDYNQMTVYSSDPLAVAKDFEAAGATNIHIVDLAGARDGSVLSFDTVISIIKNTSLQIEIGGGIRTEETICRYLDAGVRRVILGTSAVTDWDFFCSMAAKYGDQVAAGADCRDGYVAINGWRETSTVSCFDFCEKLQGTGIKTLICTDITRDGAMSGTNRTLYRELTKRFSMHIIASGGVSSLGDVLVLKEMGLYGAIIGKAYYTGAIRLADAIEAAR